MPLWQRLVVTLLAMAAASLIVGLIWQALFGLELPSYVAGVMGGITAVSTWEFLTDSAQRGRDPAQEHGPRLGGPAFLAAHPKLSIDLVLNDRTVDLIEEGVDIGLRRRGAAQTNPEPSAP